jgi:hypothetical protein
MQDSTLERVSPAGNPLYTLHRPYTGAKPNSPSERDRYPTQPDKRHN